MPFRVILTGATGLVGEGVLLECLSNPAIERVLVVGRRPCGVTHEKLSEALSPDFLQLDAIAGQLGGWDACFYCAGISSRGLDEEQYTKITYDAPMHFAKVLLEKNPGAPAAGAAASQMVFAHISGASTDGSEKGRIMWARVKGKTENALMKLPFKAVYNFRPGMMKPSPGQKNVRGYYKALAGMYPVLHALFPGATCTMREVALAMINSVLKGAPKNVLEVRDITALAAA
jgi:uncharacterized protein YbjT (DUF2867 family)